MAYYLKTIVLVLLSSQSITIAAGTPLERKIEGERYYTTPNYRTVAIGQITQARNQPSSWMVHDLPNVNFNRDVMCNRATNVLTIPGPVSNILNQPQVPIELGLFSLAGGRYTNCQYTGDSEAGDGGIGAITCDGLDRKAICSLVLKQPSKWRLYMVPHMMMPKWEKCTRGMNELSRAVIRCVYPTPPT